MKEIQTRSDNTPVKADFDLPAQPFPKSVRVVIVGSGIAGASLAYHFSIAGWTDVVVLEQNQLSSGTTWHSAGQVGQLRSSSAQTKVNKASADLYSQLKTESGYDPGWLQCGGLQLASTNERMHQLTRSAALAELFGVEAQIVCAQECQNYWPMLNTEDLVGGVYLPGDGRVLPGECTIALAKAAIANGVRFYQGTSVERLVFQEKKGGHKRFTGVETNRGSVTCEWIVLANNIWMRQIGLSAGVDIPVYPCEHHYVVTRPIPGVTRHSPCTRDPDAGLYFRALDDGGMKLGAFKKRSKPWQIGDKAPSDFGFSLLEPDWPDFAEPFAAHVHRLKGITRDDVVKFVNGPEAFTPDNNFILGQPTLTEGLFVMGGWNSAGIACAGGAGKYAVEWIENGNMTIDLGSVDIRRFMPFQNKRDYLQHRVSEVLGLHYQMAWPGRQMETSRNVRSSSLLDLHKKNNACIGEVAGWERPLFFETSNKEPNLDYSFVRQNWHEVVAEEVKACRNNVAILDQSTFAKFQLHGPDALNILQHLCVANIDVSVDRAVYTGMLNRSGTYEADLTIVRTSDDSFYIVTATRQQTKDFAWISQHLGNQDATLTDVTESIDVVSVMGPNAMRVLKRLNSELFTNSDSAYGQVLPFSFEGVCAHAVHVSYVGEEGWEIHIAREGAAVLYQALLDIGAELNIRPVGTYAIDAMRIEKGYRAIGHELSVTETPLEAGLAWTIDWSKDFLGKRSLLKQKAAGPRKRLVCFALEDASVNLWGNEPIVWNNKRSGYTTSACFSPTLGVSVAMGYLNSQSEGRLRSSDLKTGNFAIIHNGTSYVAQASFKPPTQLRLAEQSQ